MRKLLPTIVLALSFSAMQSFAAPVEEETSSRKAPLEAEAPAPAKITAPKVHTRVNTGAALARPFGSNLFSTQAASSSSEPLNPNYQLVPGDQIDIEVWGATNYNSTVVVDAQGNIFLPDVGPVHVQGVTQGELNNVINSQVSGVYKDNVQIYTNLRGSQPVSVFVTGAVAAPGRYVGTSTDSIIDYIFRAGGIDDERGSYRSVRIIRDNQPVQDIDVYQFLINGIMPKLQIREGDTILVTERGKIVTVTGAVKNPYKFEFKSPEINGSDIVLFASPNSTATHALVSGTREGKPFKTYVPIAALSGLQLADGDSVSFSAGTHEEKIAIIINGRHQGPKEMVVPLNARLVEVLNNVPISKDVSNTEAVFIRRKSVADKQQKSIDESLKRLQETLLLARASGQTPSDTAPVSAAEAGLLNDFIEKAKQVKPEGRVVVTRDGKISNISLEDGDEIVIPQKTDLVMVNGEVFMPQAIVWQDDLSVDDYIEKSGGFTDRANEDDFVIVKANGETVVGDAEIMPGDEIMVLPEVKLNNLDVATKVVDVLYKVAVAAVIPILSLSDNN